MVYVLIFDGTSNSYARTFSSVAKMIEFCWDLSEIDSIKIERPADSSFDYYVFIDEQARLRNKRLLSK